MGKFAIEKPSGPSIIYGRGKYCTQSEIVRERERDRRHVATQDFAVKGVPPQPIFERANTSVLVLLLSGKAGSGRSHPKKYLNFGLAQKVARSTLLVLISTEYWS